jgi:hypothetical protein
VQDVPEREQPLADAEGGRLLHRCEIQRDQLGACRDALALLAA